MEPPRAILRRGQAFFVAIRFTRDYTPDDIVHLMFALGKSQGVKKYSILRLV